MAVLTYLTLQGLSVRRETRPTESYRASLTALNLAAMNKNTTKLRTHPEPKNPTFTQLENPIYV